MIWRKPYLKAQRLKLQRSSYTKNKDIKSFLLSDYRELSYSHQIKYIYQIKKPTNFNYLSYSFNPMSEIQRTPTDYKAPYYIVPKDRKEVSDGIYTSSQEESKTCHWSLRKNISSSNYIWKFWIYRLLLSSLT